MKGYEFKVEFVVWGKENWKKAKFGLEDFLLKACNEEGFNIKEPKFMGEVEDPAEKLRKEVSTKEGEKKKGDKLNARINQRAKGVIKEFKEFMPGSIRK